MSALGLLPPIKISLLLVALYILCLASPLAVVDAVGTSCQQYCVDLYTLPADRTSCVNGCVLGYNVTQLSQCTSNSSAAYVMGCTRVVRCTRCMEGGCDNDLQDSMGFLCTAPKSGVNQQTPPYGSTMSPTASNDNSARSGPAIAAYVIVALVVVAVIIALVVIHRKKKQPSEEGKRDRCSSSSTSTPPDMSIFNKKAAMVKSGEHDYFLAKRYSRNPSGVNGSLDGLGTIAENDGARNSGSNNSSDMPPYDRAKRYSPSTTGMRGSGYPNPLVDYDNLHHCDTGRSRNSRTSPHYHNLSRPLAGSPEHHYCTLEDMQRNLIDSPSDFTALSAPTNMALYARSTKAGGSDRSGSAASKLDGVGPEVGSSGNRSLVGGSNHSDSSSDSALLRYPSSNAPPPLPPRDSSVVSEAAAADESEVTLAAAVEATETVVDVVEGGPLRAHAAVGCDSVHRRSGAAPASPAALGVDYRTLGAGLRLLVSDASVSSSGTDGHDDAAENDGANCNTAGDEAGVELVPTSISHPEGRASRSSKSKQHELRQEAAVSLSEELTREFDRILASADSDYNRSSSGKDRGTNASSSEDDEDDAGAVPRRGESRVALIRSPSEKEQNSTGNGDATSTPGKLNTLSSSASLLDGAGAAASAAGTGTLASTSSVANSTATTTKKHAPRPPHHKPSGRSTSPTVSTFTGISGAPLHKDGAIRINPQALPATDSSQPWFHPLMGGTEAGDLLLRAARSLQPSMRDGLFLVREKAQAPLDDRLVLVVFQDGVVCEFKIIFRSCRYSLAPFPDAVDPISRHMVQQLSSQAVYVTSFVSVTELLRFYHTAGSRPLLTACVDRASR